MRKFIRAVAGLTLFTFFSVAISGGCSSFTSGQPIVTYKRGDDGIVQKAPEPGQYALYSKFDTTPKATYMLGEGDRIGFEKTDGGKVRAIAGADSVELPQGNYLFKKKTVKETSEKAE